MLSTCGFENKGIVTMVTGCLSQPNPKILNKFISGCTNDWKAASNCLIRRITEMNWAVLIARYGYLEGSPTDQAREAVVQEG